MFGSKKDPGSDRLTIQVHVVASQEAYTLAQKIWNENLRTLHIDQGTHKEFLHFAYTRPRCVIWLQRDQNRKNPFELIAYWEDQKTHEVCIISDTRSGTNGDDTRPKAILNSILTTPSIVLSNQSNQ